MYRFLQLIISIIILVVIVKQATQPILQLTGTAMKFAQGQPLDRLEPAEDDEGRQLVQAFNIMAMRVNSQTSLAEVERNKLAAVLKEMTDGVVIIDAEGVHLKSEPGGCQNVCHNTGENAGENGGIGFRQHVLVDLWTRCVERGSI